MPRVTCPHCGYRANRGSFESSQGWKCPKCSTRLVWRDVATAKEKRQEEMLRERAGRRYVYPFKTIRPKILKRLAYLVKCFSENNIIVSKTEEKEVIAYVKKFLEDLGWKCSERVVRDYAYTLIAMAHETSLA